MIIFGFFKCRWRGLFDGITLPISIVVLHRGMIILLEFQYYSANFVGRKI